jgi:hypothetical protein
MQLRTAPQSRGPITLLPGTMFPPGTTNQPVTIQIMGDANDELGKRFL